jgi:ribbon-helix-helix CopG family protein
LSEAGWAKAALPPPGSSGIVSVFLHYLRSLFLSLLIYGTGDPPLLFQDALMYAKRLLIVCQAHTGALFDIYVLLTLLYNCKSDMKFRRREKQIGVRLRADQHAALREIAEREGYGSVSEFVRDLLEKAIKNHRRKSKF